MPGLQSIVSAWVKVNQGHGEYFGDVSSVRDAASTSSAPAPGQHQIQVEPGMTSLSGVVFNESGIVHQRQVQPPSSSNSSLSTYNLSKGASFATGATGASTTSPHQQQENRSLLHSQLEERDSVQHSVLHTTLQHGPQHLSHVPQVHHRRRPPSSLSNSQFHHVSYHPKNAQQQAPAHPQAGADAILGRRKSSSSGGASVGSNRRLDAENTNYSSGYRRRSREIDSMQPHRQDNRDNIHMLSQSISEFERRGPIGADVLDKIQDEFSLNDRKHRGFGLLDDGRNSFGTNDTFRRDLNDIQRLENSRRERQMSNITDSSSDIIDEKTMISGNMSAKSSSSAAIPIPTASSSGRTLFGKRIQKSHSRTDLVREMALDRNPRGRGKKNSSDRLNEGDSVISSNNNSPRRSSSFVSLARSEKDGEENELDISGTSGDHKSTVAPLPLGSGANAPIAGTNSTTSETLPVGMTSMQQSSMKHSPQTGAVSSSGMSNLSKGLQQTSPLMAQQGPSSLADPSDFSFHTSLGSHSMSQSHVPMGAASTAAASMPNRTKMMQPGWFPYHSEQEHLIRASALSRRMSSGSHSTIETGNLASRQVAVESISSNDVANQESHQMTSPLGTLGKTSGVAARQMGSNPECAKCSQLEATLLSLQADVEYLRTLELQREFVCTECESSAGNAVKHPPKIKKSSSHRSSKLHPPSIPENPSDGKSQTSAVSTGSKTSSRLAASKLRRPSSGSMGGASRSSLRGVNVRGSRTATFLRDASKRLEELSTRHKRQVKQSTHERAYWQNDMHLKLEKFASMAKNLNEEAAKRSIEVKETKASLEKVTSERNALVSQVDMLKARVALYEGEGVGSEEMRKEWEVNELQYLADLKASRKEQDAIIKDLSSRLELAIKTIDMERRQQQQQRRQIIFPSSRQNSGENSPSSPHQKGAAAAEAAKAEDLEVIKQTSKEATRKYQMMLESVMTQSAAREKELLDRVQALERDLRGTRNSNEFSVQIPSSSRSTGSL